MSASAAHWLFNFAVNAVWRVALLYAAAWLLARLVRPLGARAEHRVWVGALLLEVMLPACSLSLHPAELVSRMIALLHPSTSGSGEVRVLLGPALAGGDAVHLPTLLMQLSAALYLCVTVYFAARLAWGLWRTHQLVRASTMLTLPANAASFWTRICRMMQLSVDEIGVAVSSSLRSPMTIGLSRRWLLLPTAFLNEVSEAELEAACAHECAHMRRNDFAKNLLYSLLALPVTFHPLAWRTLAGIRESRELICDALAASALTNQKRYARSLLRLAERLTSAAMREPRTMHAIGIFDANIFERRIMRLTHPTLPVRGLRRFVTIALCALSATAICASALAWRAEINPQATSETNPDAAKSKHVKHVLISSSVAQGNLVTKTNPVYPKEAKENRIEGAVILQAVIGKDGAIKELRVKDGPKELQKSALDAVRQWKYRPYLLNGDPVEVETTINVVYSLAG
ncbi:MAG TPA: M56 family metallopeptidase [Acidobacteriaceae bacterium]|nr:M56 family metallopeptidase [Acidobacteriaceae bacterium]